MVLISDINNAYEYLVNEISRHYYSINEEKELVFVNIELVNITEDIIVVEMKDYVAQKPGPPNPNYLPNFGPEDNWIWGLLGGKCNNGGYLHEKDAATQLTEKANILGYGPGIYWMNIYTISEIYPGNPSIQTETNPYNYTPSLLFENSGTGTEPLECLTYPQMNYYLNNLRMIGLIFKPIGKSVMNYFVESSVVVGAGWGHDHIATIKYGVPVSIGVQREIVPPPHN